MFLVGNLAESSFLLLLGFGRVLLPHKADFTPGLGFRAVLRQFRIALCFSLLLTTLVHFSSRIINLLLSHTQLSILFGLRTTLIHELRPSTGSF